MINKKLAEELGLSEKVKFNINSLHKYRDRIFKRMEDSVDKEELRSLDLTLDRVEFTLQRLWGWKPDRNYIKFWNRPKCRCPRLDNEDNYPYGYYTVMMDCPLHGSKSSEDK